MPSIIDFMNPTEVDLDVAGGGKAPYTPPAEPPSADRNHGYPTHEAWLRSLATPGAPPMGAPPAEPPPTGPSSLDDLIAQLKAGGYTSAKASEIAASLMANASNTPRVNTPSIGMAAAGSNTAGSIAAPTPIAKNTMASLLANGSGIPIGNTDPTTRDVQPEELVDNQLNNLLSSDSRYIQAARLRAIETSNRRGQLGSSFSAGAAERAAIEAGLPIAVADAQAYRDMATQNLNALNNFALANLQRATTLDVALLDSNTTISLANLDASIRVSMANLDALTRIDISNLDAQTQTSIANLSAQTQMAMQTMQSNLALQLQSQNLQHATGMEQLMQSGRVDLALLDGALAIELTKFEITGKFDLSKLDQEEFLEANAILHQYDIDNAAALASSNRAGQHSIMASAAMANYVAYRTAYANSDLDSAAAARLERESWDLLIAEFDMIAKLYPEFPIIMPTRVSSATQNPYRQPGGYGG